MTGLELPKRVVVGIATVDRPAILDQTVRALAAQERLPDLVFVSGFDKADFGTLPEADLPFPIRFVTGPKGLCRQRNRILQALDAGDILLFLDDDFLIAPDFLRELSRLYEENPDIVMITGEVIADGILGPGIDFEEGQRILARALRQPAGTRISKVVNAYGCNMAMRLAPVLAKGLRFDETLPLYGWFEDVDFSVRAARSGRVVKAQSLRGVHLGTKAGRTPGVKLGYSQVANLLYLRRKGVVSTRRALAKIAMNITSNTYHTLRPQPWTDHRGRLKGNRMALADLWRGICAPGRVMEL